MSEQAKTTEMTALDQLIQRLETLNAGNDAFGVVNEAMRDAARLLRQYRVSIHGTPSPVPEPPRAR